MVKSGLDQNPYVSNYRLAFHLTNAVIILTILIWLSLNSYFFTNVKFAPYQNIEIIFFIIIILLFLTIISGAFMAGSHAGQSFNTYPFMNGLFIPEGYYLKDFGLKNFFENTIAINFNHRWLATFTFIIIIGISIYLFINKKYKIYSMNIYLIILFLVCNFC